VILWVPFNGWVEMVAFVLVFWYLVLSTIYVLSWPRLSLSLSSVRPSSPSWGISGLVNKSLS